MLHDVVASPGDYTAAELLAAHAEQLAAVVRDVGVEPAARAADRPTATFAAIADGDVDAAGDIDLEAVAAVLALADGTPAADDIVGEARDALLFGMTAGVLNVDVVAGEVAADLDPREIQAMIEGRHPVTLREYAALQRVIEGR